MNRQPAASWLPMQPGCAPGGAYPAATGLQGRLRPVYSRMAQPFGTDPG